MNAATLRAPAPQPRAAAARRFALVGNRSAGRLGRDQALASRLSQALAECGVDAEWQLARDGRDLAQATREALDAGAEVIVAAGGDGTVNSVATAMLGSEVPLGVLPLGTLNHFAKDLGLPTDPLLAARTLTTARPRALDVGEVGGRIFLNNASVGIYPDFVKRRRERERLGWRKWPAALIASARTFVECPLLEVDLVVDGTPLRRRTAVVFVGNNQYRLEGLALAERPRLDAGQLNLCVASGAGRFALVGLVLRALAGQLSSARSFESFSARELVVATRRRLLRVATDGEVVAMATPLRFRVRPRALRVLVPE